MTVWGTILVEFGMMFSFFLFLKAIKSLKGEEND